VLNFFVIWVLEFEIHPTKISAERNISSKKNFVAFLKPSSMDYMAYLFAVDKVLIFL